MRVSSIVSRVVLLAVGLSLVTPQLLSAGGTVCRLPRLAGFDAAARRAKAFLPMEVSDPAEAVVYIERTGNKFYYHSNFVTKGEGYYATKIGSTEPIDIQAAFLDIVHDREPSAFESVARDRELRDSVRIVLDVSMFDYDGRPLIDLAGANKIAIVDARTRSVIATNGLELLNRASPPPLLLNRIRGCCLYGIPPHKTAMYAEILGKRQFQRDQARFMSLVGDSATKATIAASTHLRSRRIGPTGRVPRTLAEIETSFQSARGKTVVMIGHVESGKFVIRDARNAVVLDVPVQEMRALAAKHDVELIDLGCRTAQEIRAETVGLGVTTRFNTVDAVRAVENAFAKSRNYGEFMEGITSPGLKVVIDSTFVQRSAMQARIYAKTNVRDVWTRLADLFFTFRGAAPATSVPQ